MNITVTARTRRAAIRRLFVACISEDTGRSKAWCKRHAAGDAGFALASEWAQYLSRDGRLIDEETTITALC